MKIHISNVDFSSHSGPNSFAHRLADELTIRGHNIVSWDDPYDAMLIFIEPSTQPRPGARVVHRLDGIWFKPEQFNSHNKSIKWAYDNSDHVIWQSEFDKNMTTYHWGERDGTIVHNGIKLKKVDVINPAILKIRETYKHVFVCSSNWHAQKRLKENTDLFFRLKQKYSNSCLVVMGADPDYIIDHQDVLYTGPLSHEKCLEMFSVADWMIHLAWLDHCPNVVVEALSQQCPVICTDSGGTHEIVGKNGIILPENNPYNFELADYDKPYGLDLKSIELLNTKVDNQYLDIKKVANEYVRILGGKI